MSRFGVILVRIFPHSDWIWRNTEYLSVFSLNTGKCGPEQLQIPPHFMQCKCCFLLVLSTYKYFSLITRSLISSERVQELHHLTLHWFSFCYAWMSSWLLDLAVTWKVLDICLGKFVFCLSFERYQLILSHLILSV